MSLLARIYSYGVSSRTPRMVGGVDERADTPEVSDSGPIAKSRQEVVSWHGYELCVPPLELQLLVTERRGRVERAEKIRQFVGR